MGLCTTQLDSKLIHFVNKRYHPDTLAFISPTSTNGLTDRTYVNCNDYYTITKKELIKKIDTNKFEVTGNLTGKSMTRLDFRLT